MIADAAPCSLVPDGGDAGLPERAVPRPRGTATVETVGLRNGDGGVRQVDAPAVFVMIGAEPSTEATTGMLAVDREPHLLETVRPVVFAAGDVRSGASKRLAGAVGDGAMVVRFAHAVLSG